MKFHKTSKQVLFFNSRFFDDVIKAMVNFYQIGYPSFQFQLFLIKNEGFFKDDEPPIMKKNDRYFKIAKLISEELSGSLSAEDKVFLESWLNESDENRDIYHQIKDGTWYAEQSDNVKKYHPAEGWKNISKKIKSPSRGRSVFLTVSKYAAVAAILVSAVFFIKEITFDNGAETEVIQPKTSIDPGVKEARLILDDGRVIPLAADSAFTIEEEGTVIDKTTQVLDYGKNTAPTRREIFNTIITATGEEFALNLSDGTRVILNAESEIRFPVVFVKNERVVEVTGEAYFEVTGDTERPFIVKTPASVTQVLGTSFNVRAYGDELSEKITLVEGSVDIYRHDEESRAVNLNPGEQASVSGAGGEIEVEQVNAAYYTAWKDGRFIFRDERLEDIVGNLKRWYRFDVEYLDEEVKNVRFGATLDRYNEVNPIFNVFENTRLVDITQKENRIIISLPHGKRET